MRKNNQSGFTLLELIITLFVLSILVMGTIPLTQNAARRQKELRLRESLRIIRNAIDEFKRDTLGACPQGAVKTTNPAGRQAPNFGQNSAADPRSRVVIDDCEIFDTENIDKYPPSLEILVEGVSVKERGVNLQQNGAFSGRNATDIAANDEQNIKKKVYLREIPIDPMTGEKDWKLRSSFQPGDTDTWDDINVFDVSSSSDDEALNGEKYSDW